MGECELTEQPAGSLRCVECDATTADGFGWRTYLTIDGEPATYCLECAEREFDEP